MDAQVSPRSRTVKLLIHQRPKRFEAEDVLETEDLILSQKDFPELRVGDVVEIYHPEDEFSRLLLQIRQKSWREDTPHSHSINISVEESVAKTFCLRLYREVVVNQVRPEDVELNLLELTIKEQYFSRSDMWRYRNALMGSCAHLQKKFLHDCGRCVVHEMWAKGTRVACGYVGAKTKVVYRSFTANVYIFIQMSAEMWEFDFYGDLYFEKSVKGFLTELFDRWKHDGANHDVTIVLFSRTFYEAKTKHEFPCDMRKGLLQDYRGRFYEDFYRIVVQNEKYDDWTLALMKLKTLFHSYKETVIDFHANTYPGVKLPRAYNSTASEGNLLEVLNMGLNVFEKHDVDRNFERTGQMSVVVTPSTGVFEVDRELLMLTKQKSIDYGIGNDLVFMGEQPLHVVPLFILHNKRKIGFDDKPGSGLDDYAIPNWLNYSYYTSKEAKPNVFVPRIHIPEKALLELQKRGKSKGPIAKKAAAAQDGAGDAVSKSVSSQFRTSSTLKSRNRPATVRRLSESAAIPIVVEESSTDLQSILNDSLEDSYYLSASLETANPLRPNAAERAFDNPRIDNPVAQRKKKNKKGPSPFYTRSLINPLAPSKIPGKLTSNRRRWVHIFPIDPTGAAVQTHHFRVTSNSEDAQELSRSPVSEKDGGIPIRDTESPRLAKQRRQDEQRVQSWVSSLDGHDEVSIAEEDSGMADSLKSPQRTKNRTSDFGRGSPAPSGSAGIWGGEVKKKSSKRSTMSVWGITGEMEWTPNLTTGVDWKALTIPASLPITTDYLPDLRTLQRDFTISDYSVLPEDSTSDSSLKLRQEGLEHTRYYSRPLELDALYEELILQRLQQGFQLIISNDQMEATTDPTTKDKLRKPQQRQRECYLSLGRVIHKLILEPGSITVTRLHPRHVYKTPEVKYLYRFMVPDMIRYEISTVKFTHTPLEILNWNYCDFVVVSKGRGGEFKLEYTKKHWKCQYYLLPCAGAAVKQILDGYSRCDIFTEKTPEDCDKLCEGFVRIMEMCNRTKRTSSNRPKASIPKRSVTTKSLHRDSTAISTPDLQSSAASTPRQDHMLHHHNSEILKVAGNLGLDLAADVSASPKLANVFIPTPSYILDAMKLPAEQVVNTTKVTDLPQQYFVSYEAIVWAMDTFPEAVPTLEKTIELFEGMIRDKMICHASGDYGHPFICGTYLYYVVEPDPKHPVVFELPVPQDEFSDYWLESAIICPDRETFSTAVHESFKKDPQFPVSQSDGPDPSLYPLNVKKSSVVDIDLYHKSTRLEWAIANYNSTYSPRCAFAIELKWIQSSGPMFGDLINFWATKCARNQLHLVPVPSDPFALPQKPYSDPLRMPIFVPLDVAALTKGDSPLFSDFPVESRYMRTVLFQEEILQRFGFVYLQENVKRTNVETQFREYVHVTGGMFVMIPAREQQEEFDAPDSSFPGFEADCNPPDAASKIGFWWAWNSCLTKKWRNNNTGDEAFLDKMLLDFRQFCSNSDNRLLELWTALSTRALHPTIFSY